MLAELLPVPHYGHMDWPTALIIPERFVQKYHSLVPPFELFKIFYKMALKMYDFVADNIDLGIEVPETPLETIGQGESWDQPQLDHDDGIGLPINDYEQPQENYPSYIHHKLASCMDQAMDNPSITWPVPGLY